MLEGQRRTNPMVAIVDQRGLLWAPTELSPPHDDEARARPCRRAPQGLVGRADGRPGRRHVPQLMPTEDFGAQGLNPEAC